MIRDVSSPMFICDTFTERRLRGNPCAVCFCPTNVYCGDWADLSMMEASIGRGAPVSANLSQKEQEEKDRLHAEERDRLMGEAFQKVSAEMNLSETCFVYRLPAARIKNIKDVIRQKLTEFHEEHEARCRQAEESAMEQEFLKEMPAGATTDEALAAAAKNLFKGGLIPSASFMGCLESSMSMGNFSSFGRRSGAAKKLNVQWFGLRWFTPKGESSMCGHGTLAAAHCLVECSRLGRQEATRKLVSSVPGEFFLPTQTDVVCFVTDLGIITVRLDETMKNSYRTKDPIDVNHVRDSYEVHFPSNEPKPGSLALLPAETLQQMCSALNIPKEAVEDIAVTEAMGTYLVRLRSVADVMKASPNEVAIKAAFQSEAFLKASSAHPHELFHPQGIILTAANNGSLTSGRGADAEVISRFFQPWSGVLEDPVSGSAHTIIAPYWVRRRRNGEALVVGDAIVCYQASERGGYVPCTIIGKQAERVALYGSSVVTLRGSITYELCE